MQNPPSGVLIDGGDVRRRRQLKGDDLVTFAPKAQISVQYLSQIELGQRRTVSPKVFARICDALGIAEDDREQLVKDVAA
jgi:transcriptional regulator with XRE-family HTH domain